MTTTRVFSFSAGKRFDEFPVGNLPETLFGNNSLSPNDDDNDDIRFRAAMTSSSSSSLLPVCSLRHLRGLCSGLDLGRPPRPPSSSSVGLLRPHEEPPTGAPQRRRPRGAPRQRRNGVVSSTTFDLPMTSSYDPTTTMTSLYRQQISSSSSMMSSSSATAFQRRDLYRRSPVAFLFYAQGAPLERRLLQPMDLYCGRVVAGGASSLAVGDRGVTPPPGSTDGDRFVYDDCGALDLTVPKVVRSA